MYITLIFIQSIFYNIILVFMRYRSVRIVVRVNCKWLSANVDSKLMRARYNDKPTGVRYSQPWASPLTIDLFIRIVYQNRVYRYNSFTLNVSINIVAWFFFTHSITKYKLAWNFTFGELLTTLLSVSLNLNQPIVK